jgi:hypothetical protein
MSRPSIGVWCVNQRNILVYFQIDILKSQWLQRIVVSKSNLIGLDFRKPKKSAKSARTLKTEAVNQKPGSGVFTSLF